MTGELTQRLPEMDTDRDVTAEDLLDLGLIADALGLESHDVQLRTDEGKEFIISSSNE